jgi:prepilin-type N-terminal cleavage/methylation domain-containing protein
MGRAFTAIELAVVLVIICILAAMLLPALEQGREEAIKTKCLGRVRQIGMAMEMYQSANGGYWPTARRSITPGDPDAPDPTASLAALYPLYAAKLYLFQCPATEDLVGFEPDNSDFLRCSNFFVGPDGRSTRPQDEGKKRPSPPSYFYDGGDRWRYRIPRQSKPSRVVYGDECVQGYRQDARGRGFWVGENNHPREGGNFLFADKHAEWLSVQWTGEPYDEGRSVPYVPNPHFRAGAGRPGPGGYVTWLDTNVFADDGDGPSSTFDADLAGMLWLGDHWEEF